MLKMNNKVKELFEKKRPDLILTFWGSRLIKAYDRGHTTVDDRSNSTRWNMCACGESVPELLTDNDYNGLEPKDVKLFAFGGAFCEDVINACNMNLGSEIRREYILNAARTQIDIEERVDVLLSRMGMEYADE